MGTVLSLKILRFYWQKTEGENRPQEVTKKLSKKLRDIYEEEDLIKLFNDSPWFTTELKDTLRHNPEYIFIPLICLYNGGAKPTEVAQLHTSDIKKHKGIWVIHFNDEDDEYEESHDPTLHH